MTVLAMTKPAMTTGKFIIEIKPKKTDFDPLAHGVTRELVESGVPPAKAVVTTNRLYRLEGELTLAQVHKAAELLLVDPVIEVWQVVDLARKLKKGKGRGFVIDVWPRPGVTDPVGETVKKGLRDLGFFKITSSSSGIRYIFPRILEPQVLETLAKRNLANELVHNVTIRKANESY